MLDTSRPDTVDIDAAMVTTVESMVASVTHNPRPAERSRSWKRPMFLVPAIGLLALATTAGAVAYSFSKADAVVIPINYTTANGQQISCGYGISGSTEPTGGDVSAFRQFLRTHDWGGTGQKVYQYAVDHPYLPLPSEKGEFTQSQIDSFSFSEALAVVIGDQIPASVEPSGYLGGGESDCRGTLR
jgi:hypothetical protein